MKRKTTEQLLLEINLLRQRIKRINLGYVDIKNQLEKEREIHWQHEMDWLKERKKLIEKSSI